jgi:hypothetical protein
VTASDGVPPVVVTLVASLILSVKVRFCPGPYVLLDGAVTEEIVGPVISLVTEVVVRAFEDGPFVFVTVPSTEFAISCGIMVPALQDETVRVKLVPDDALMENEQPVAVPELEKSALAMPETF